MRFTAPRFGVLLLPVLISLFTAGCGGGESDEKTIRIAEQFGLAYAPVQLVRIGNILEKTGTRVEWVRLMNTASIREAMLAGRVDVGFMGIPPFLIGRERGMDWQIFTGICRAPLGLVTLRPELGSLADFDEKDRIALPQPGSIQHILLSMAALKEFGRADYFDNRLTTLSHPDGMTALVAGGDIAAHFTSPPYLFEELELPGARLLVDGTAAFGGPFTFIVGVSRDAFAQKEPELLAALGSALAEEMRRLESDPAEAAQLLTEEYSLPADAVRDYLDREGFVFEPQVRGVERFAEFMADAGLLEEPHG
jgi:sulfonate transport system substrate-binding protein